MDKARIWILVLLVSAMIFLAGGWSMGQAIQYTSSNDFCISCHEMKSTVYVEYQKTTHYKNRSGVRASCSDCHVPHDWSQTIWRKILAVKDVYHHFAGTIDSKEKFEQHRLAMAERVWNSMQKSDSRECRNCHEFSTMVLDEQRKRAATSHQKAIIAKQTCIDCHKGIAHKPVHEIEQANPEEELILEF